MEELSQNHRLESVLASIQTVLYATNIKLDENTVCASIILISNTKRESEIISKEFDLWMAEYPEAKLMVGFHGKTKESVRVDFLRVVAGHPIYPVVPTWDVWVPDEIFELMKLGSVPEFQGTTFLSFSWDEKESELSSQNQNSTYWIDHLSFHITD